MGFRKMDETTGQGNFSFREFNRLDIVDFLSTYGIHPQKIVRNNYWYLSPLRDEKVASFKVNRAHNCWYDFGSGEGTTLTDFCIRYFHCTIGELIQKFSTHLPAPFILRRTAASIESRPEDTLTVERVHPLESPLLIHYIRQRRIPLHIAQRYCRQALYRLYGKSRYAICFRNRSGGSELRNRYFKGSSAPKDISLVGDGESDEIAVFEGFFDFLSYLAMGLQADRGMPHFLILNSLSLTGRAMPLLHRYKKVELYLDNDPAGLRYKKQVLSQLVHCSDHSTMYEGYKDLNDWLCRIPAPVS